MNYPVLVWWLALTVCVPSVVLSIATSHNETNVEDYGITWIFLPDENGNPQVVYLDESPESEGTSNEPLVIQVELYNRNNRFRDKGTRTKFVVYDAAIFQTETDTLKVINDFDARLDTKMMTHGFQSSSNDPVVTSIRDSYIGRGNLNIFAIDWSKKADEKLWKYKVAADKVVEVGQAVAKLIKLLVDKKKADSKRIHLIGHSLGAHVMGNAGLDFTSISRKTIGRITGLDPAGPEFEDNNQRTHLEAAHADFVDVIHTDMNKLFRAFFYPLGFKLNIGHVDFYPNGNKYHQGSCDTRGGSMSCSHSRAYEYYNESINSKLGFYSVPCSNLEAALNANCVDDGDQILMGDPVPLSARGIYFLRTCNDSPFAKGKYDPNSKKCK